MKDRSRALSAIAIPCVLIILSFLVFSGRAAAQAASAYQEIFDAAWQKVNDSFYDPAFTGVDWRAVRDRYRPQALRAANNTEFHDVMKRMLKELPVSHLEIRMPREAGHSGTGVRTALIEGNSVIVEVPSASDAQRQGIRVGDMIRNPDSDKGPLGSTATLRVKGCDGRTRVVKVRREIHSSSERPSIRWRKFSVGTGKRIGYIRTVRFDDDTAPAVDAAMAEMKDTTALIIDARDNTGGNMSFVRLSSYFSEGEHLVAALLNRSYLEAQGRTPQQIDPARLPKATRTYTDEAVFSAMSSNGGAVAIFSEDLGKNLYAGKVVVLINEETASAAEGFAWHMKLKTNATLIGRTTAGALLGAEYFTLPGGWRLAVPTHSGWGPDGKPIIDQPVKPHIEIRRTLKDVCSNADPEMATALELISASESTSK